MEQMEKTMKKEGEVAEATASPAAPSDTETDSNFSKPDPGLVQSVKREFRFTKDVLVREEILEDGSQAASTEQMARTMKKEGAAGEVAASSAAHSDTETNFNFLKSDPGLLQSVKREFPFTTDALVKEEILEDGSQDDSEQQCVDAASTSAGSDGVNKACSTCLGDLFDVKYESTEIDIGPTMLQHMDMHYTINKHNMNAAMEENTTAENTNDDCNEAMPGSGGRNRSVENKRRDNKTTSHNCAQTTTEMDYDKAHVKSSMTPHVRLEREDLHKLLLHQHRTTSSNGFKCDRTFHEPHLQSARNKLNRRNNRKAVPTRGPVAGPFNQSKDIRVKTKPKSFACDFCGNEYFSKVGLNLDKCSHCRVKLKNRLENYKNHTRKTHYTRDEKFAQSDLAQARFHTGANLFPCETCDARFTRSTLLTRHMRIHTGEKSFQCEMCDAKFAQKGSVIRHMRIHTGEKPFHCETCDAKFGHKYHLIRHMRVHTGEMPFQCETCNAKFSQRGILTKHMRVHTGEKPYQYKICNVKFSQTFSLTQHQRVHTGEKPFQCETCSARFAQRGNLVEHMRIHTGEKPFHCETCGVRFTRSTILTRHMRIHTGEKSFQCETCDAKLAQKGYLIIHMRIHTGEKPYHCKTCSARFAQRGYLAGHMRIHTGEKPFQCETCSARFAQRGHLVEHMRIHTGEKPFHCETCGVRFTRSTILTRHMRIHTGEKSFQCETCDAKLAQKGYLIIHMRIHTGEKPYHCKTCSARFAQRGYLAGHMRIHTGEKPFQCDKCDAKFAQKGSLNSHMRVHTGEKPFQCKMCDAKFSKSSVLTRHMRVHSGEKPFHCETCGAKYAQKWHLIKHMRIHTRVRSLFSVKRVT